MGQKNMICRRIFLPYKIAPVSVRKSSIYITFYCEKRLQKYFMYWLLRQINFFFPTRCSIGILITDFEGIFDVIFWQVPHRIVTYVGETFPLYILERSPLTRSVPSIGSLGQSPQSVLTHALSARPQQETAPKRKNFYL